MPADIHALAVEAEKSAEALATALAHEGASEPTVKQITTCADIFRQVVQALGKGQEETGDEEPAGEPASIDQAAGETGEAMQSAAAQRNA